MPLLFLTKPTAAASVVFLTALVISARDSSVHVTAFAPVSSAVNSCYSRTTSSITTVEEKQYHHNVPATRPLSSSATSSDTEGSTATENEKSKPKKKKFVKPQRRQNINNQQNKIIVNRKNNNSNNSRNGNKSNNDNDNDNHNTKSFKPLKDLQPGSKLTGKVIDVCDFGAFVNIGYATRGSRPGTALLHISQISDDRIENIHDVLKKGDIVRDARVITVDLAKGEVGLSLRKQRPKRRDLRTVRSGEELEGKVEKIVPYGAFVDVGVEVNPLLHISRITGGAIENIRHHLNEGDPVTVHVIDVDLEKKTMAVSMLDRKADLYLDRRMSQKMKRFYGRAKGSGDDADGGDYEEGDNDGDKDEDDPSELDYFDQAIRELEEALKDRK
ncbi:hypothetical protein ACHAXS_001959 [Conticribra weissflogii]